VNVPHPRNQEILEAGIESCLRIIEGAEEGKEEAVFSEWAGHAIRSCPWGRLQGNAREAIRNVSATAETAKLR
jgi:hypothetical protein